MAAVRDLVVHPRESDLVIATHGRGIWIIDNISSLRSLTPETMAQEAVLFDGKAVQLIESNGGWPEGDATFFGSSRSSNAFITYYQRSRHIFGDMKIEIFDQDGKLLDTIAGSKHRGLNRALWSMRVKAPIVPPAASAAFGANTGPRVLPGTYTVRLTKGDKTYTTKLELVMDPRNSYYTLDDRKAQFALAMKLHKMLGRMSYGVDAIVNVHDSARDYADKLPQGDSLRKDLEQLVQQTDALRSKIVATTEGGAITGEERIREFMTTLYGAVNGYEGRPTDSQVARTDALGRELEDVIHDFEQLTARELPGINSRLQQKKLPTIKLITQQEWEQMHQDTGGTQPSVGGRFQERD